MACRKPLCVECAKHGKTCCQGNEVYVTVGDVIRIRQFTGQIGFHEYAKAINPAYLDQSDDPVWAACTIRPDGSRRVLKRKPSEDCIFLGEAGCLLPLEIRPLVCRLHPYAFTALGIQTDPEDGCPLERLPPGVTLMDSLDMSLEKARRWHHQLYEEILHDTDDHWPDLRLAV